jgi:predicted ATP-binding protein involved in virulence
MKIPNEEEDVRPVPTLEFPYRPVPIVLCSAGIKRIVALAYLLVWAWNEHVVNSELICEKPQRSIVLLIDEMEAHLHPFWQ